MKKFSAIFASIAMLSSVAVLAAPPKAKTAKAVDVWTCPMTGEAIKDHKQVGKTLVVSGKKVHFCCAGCPEKFHSLSAKDQKAKVLAAAKKEAPAKKS